MRNNQLNHNQLISKTDISAGEICTESILKRYKVSNEAFSSIKELKIYRKEKVFIDRFRKVSFLEAGYTIKSNLIAFLPRHFLESLI